jgi:hypothetical protein
MRKRKYFVKDEDIEEEVKVNVEPVEPIEPISEPKELDINEITWTIEAKTSDGRVLRTSLSQRDVPQWIIDQTKSSL